MTNNWTLSRKLPIVVAICAQLLFFSSDLAAQQVNPRGVPRVPTNVDPEREWERDRPRIRRGEAEAPNRRLILREIKEDFARIQMLNDVLPELLNSTPLDYRHVADVASKIKSVAGRLDSNLALGKSDLERPHTEIEFREQALRSFVVSLHDLVTSFVGNPVFRERGVFDIEQTRRAKQDVDAIIAVSHQVKKTAKRLAKAESK